jgi:cytochrome oxidase assembly protein ShyY1
VPDERRSLLIPAIMTLAALAVFIGLGTWQIERKAWKEDLIDMLTRRLEAEPVDLPQPAGWARLGADTAEFRRVRLNVQFPKANDALVYTSGSQVRDDVKGQGFFVFSPAKLASGATVVVNRGFTPGKTYPSAEGVPGNAQGNAQGNTQEIVGVLRWPEPPSWFTPDRDSAGTWYLRDHQAMAKALSWGEVAPFYIEMEDPVPPGGVPHPSVLKVRLRNDHLQYAITWFGLAAVTAIMFALWARRRREASAGD